MQGKILWIVYGAVGIILIVAILFVTGVFGSKSENRSGTVVVWDLARDASAVPDFFASYKSPEDDVAVRYAAKNPATYESALLDALASGEGPDIFVIDAREIISFINKISPLSAGDSLADEIRAKAADVVRTSLFDTAGNVYGIPLGLDTLALFYNRDLMNAANIPEPPKTWEEFETYARLMTKLSPVGQIQRSGAALGLSSNVAHASEILQTLFFQAGNPIYAGGEFRLVENETPTGEVFSGPASALEFYASFADANTPNYGWNSGRPDSLEAFAAGDLAFYIGYARDIPAIVSRNSHLNFSVAELPQLTRGGRTSAASFTVFTVARTSKNPALAWSVLTRLFSAETEKRLIDAEGTAPARRDLIGSKPPHPVLQPFYNQVLSARLLIAPHPREVDRVFRSMMDAAVAGIAPETALSRASDQLRALTR